MAGVLEKRDLIVGRTPIIWSNEFSKRCDRAKVYIMCENANPFGTFKDRGNLGALKFDEERSIVGRKLDIVVGITYGNAGYSLGMLAGDYLNFAPDSWIKVVNIVPHWLSPEVEALLRTCSIVHRMNLDDHEVTKEEMTRIAKGYAVRYGSIIGKIHVVEEPDYMGRYGEIVDEIHKAGIRPTHIFCPVGGGGLLTGIAAQAERIWGAKAPLIVGATVPGNALIGDNASGAPRSTLADKLANRYSPLAGRVSRLVASGKVKLMSVNDGDILTEYRHLDRMGLLVEPSAAVAFCGALRYPLERTDTAVIINTGRGVCYDMLHGPAGCYRRISERNPGMAGGKLLEAVKNHRLIEVVSALREAPSKPDISEALGIARQQLADREWDIEDSMRFNERMREIMYRAVADGYRSIIGTLEIASRWPEKETGHRTKAA